MKSVLATFALVVVLCAPVFAAESLGSYLPREIAAGDSFAKDGFSGNVKTKKFHNSGCKHFQCQTCTKYFESEDAAIKAGYDRCGWCFK